MKIMANESCVSRETVGVSLLPLCESNGYTNLDIKNMPSFLKSLKGYDVKSWLKSVSAFANIGGGSLFYGVNTVMGVKYILTSMMTE